MRVKISELENKNKREYEWNKKTQFFEKIIKINKHSSYSNREEKNERINKWLTLEQRQVITLWNQWIVTRIIRDYYEQIYANLFNLYEMKNSLEKFNLLKLR